MLFLSLPIKHHACHIWDLISCLQNKIAVFDNFKWSRTMKIQTHFQDQCHNVMLLLIKATFTETSRWALQDGNIGMLYLVQWKLLQAKVMNLEGRSRRNNICMYSIKEGTERSFMLTFMSNFLKKLNSTVDLQIQWAHWPLGPKPQHEAISRSILVNFQTYDIKGQNTQNGLVKED